MDFLTFMAEATPYGHLLINGHKPTPQKLAALTLTPVAVIKKAIAELLENGVASQTDDGVLYSRRLVRDRERQEKARLDGVKGGNPKLREKGITPRDNNGTQSGITGGDNPHGKSHSQKPESISHSQKPEQPAERDVVGLLQAACGIAGIDQGKVVNWLGIGAEWLRTGLSDERILAVVREIAGRPGYTPKGSLAYFTPMIREAAAIPEPAKAAELTREQQQDFLNRYVKHFARDGVWRGHGPKPGEPGCLASPDVLREHGYEVTA
jgi:hypothetical protein